MKQPTQTFASDSPRRLCGHSKSSASALLSHGGLNTRYHNSSGPSHTRLRLHHNQPPRRAAAGLSCLRAQHAAVRTARRTASGYLRLVCALKRPSCFLAAATERRALRPPGELRLPRRSQRCALAPAELAAAPVAQVTVPRQAKSSKRWGARLLWRISDFLHQKSSSAVQFTCFWRSSQGCRGPSETDRLQGSVGPT